jgi:hypothetical protein
MPAPASASCFAHKLSQLLPARSEMNPAQAVGLLKKLFVIKAVWLLKNVS